jgi:serine phosphatase RsbU (regulator of sigma subunit)/anti-sigma regulatory factor (Ser/Thr protein kinase)/CHASE3 domain sensor protein
MRFGIRPQVLLLAVVPAVSLLILVALTSLLVKQTEQGNAVNQQLAETLELSDTMTRDVSVGIRSVQDFVASKRVSDLAPFETVHAALPQEARRFVASLHGIPALEAPGTTYARNSVQVMEVLGRFLDAYRKGGSSAAQRVAREPATRRLGPALQNSKIAFDRAAQPRALQQLADSHSSLQRLERILVGCALVGLVLTLLVALLYAVRIVKRLEMLGDNARRLAFGVPTLPVTGNDELAELDRIYREMGERIQTTLLALRHERDATSLLQQALLPEIVPIPGLHVATAYATPSAGTQIGGDWFDVFVLSERLVGLSVGDVTGHGLRAAAVMGFVRQAIRIVARRESDPARVMEHVNEVLCNDEREILVTAFFAVLDRVSHELVYTLAGHGAPLVVDGRFRVTPLDGAGTLLGLDAATSYRSYSRTLAPDDGLILYTDGIVELDREYLTGMVELENAVRSEFREPSPNLAEGIQARVFRDRTPRDDAALLVVTFAERPPTNGQPQHTWDFDARRQDAAHHVKGELMAALRSLGPIAPDPTVAEIVFGELLSNVVQHTPGPARVRFDVEGGRVVLAVEDRERSLPRDGQLSAHPGPPEWDAESGRGLFLITSLCEHVVVEPTRDGKCTIVVLPGA